MIEKMEQRQRNRFDGDLTMKEMGAETTGTTGAALTCGSLPECCVMWLLVEAVSGTSPVLSLSFQGSNNGSDWVEFVVSPDITEACEMKIAVGLQDYTFYRTVSTISGSDTPSFTYAVQVSA